MSDIIKINKLELASELANEATRVEMFSKGLIAHEDEMYVENESGTTYTEEAQDIFNDYYDCYLTKIEEIAE
jgi:hypothetical protein